MLFTHIDELKDELSPQNLMEIIYYLSNKKETKKNFDELPSKSLYKHILKFNFFTNFLEITLKKRNIYNKIVYCIAT